MLCCASFIHRQDGFEGIDVGVPAILGKAGVEMIVEISLVH